MELTREEACKYAVFATDNDVSRFAKALLIEMDKPKIWDGAPNNANMADISFWADCKLSAVNPVSRKKVGAIQYTRPLPKSPEREIAERRSKVIVSTQITERELIADQIEAAINEYKEREK